MNDRTDSVVSYLSRHVSQSFLDFSLSTTEKEWVLSRLKELHLPCIPEKTLEELVQENRALGPHS